MRRGKPLKRGRALQRSKPLKAKVALRRDKALKAKPGEPADELTRQAQLAFHSAGLAACERDKRRRYVCPVCRQGYSKGQMQVHHVTAQQAIRRFVSSWRLERADRDAVLVERLWDPRNALALCTDCHTRHTTAVWRVPRRQVPEQAVEFALEVEAEHLLDRYYPS